MSFDFKKEFSDLYQPSVQPGLVQVHPMQYVAVSGCGNPNQEGGAYKQAVGALYAVSYTIKMSKMGSHRLDGFFDFVVPPLEGFWWHENAQEIDFADKEHFQWISMIRMPDFVTQDVLQWAKQEAERKKGIDCAAINLLQVEEGLCVQMLHIGSYDDEPASILKMKERVEAEGYRFDYSETRRHHEIYLSDPRRTAPERLKTVIRLPITEKENCQ